MLQCFVMIDQIRLSFTLSTHHHSSIFFVAPRIYQIDSEGQDSKVIGDTSVLVMVKYMLKLRCITC